MVDLPEPDKNIALWNDHAQWWQDEFTDGVDLEYTEQILPLIVGAAGGPGRTLDLGTGEGQVGRELAATGSVVVGIDPIWDQMRVAKERGGGVLLSQAVAADLPFPSGSFDRVVACLVFEHIDDVDAAISEVARVLRPGGDFVFLLNHPLLQTPGSGWIDDQMLDPPEQYWRIGPYLTETATVEQVQKGVYIRFVHRPLSRYLNALAEAGLMLVRMDEPAPPPGFLAMAPDHCDASSIPRLLVLRLTKGASGEAKRVTGG